MKSRPLLLFGSTALILLLTCAGGMFAANKVVKSALPGDSLFSARQVSESFFISFAPGASARTQSRINIAAYRLNDLMARVGTPNETLALAYFDDAINRALLAIADAPASDRAARLQQLVALTDGAAELLAQVPVSSAPEIVANFGKKAEQIHATSARAEIVLDDLRNLAAISLDLPIAVLAQTSTNGALSPRDIPIPAGFKHSFPLDGARARGMRGAPYQWQV